MNEKLQISLTASQQETLNQLLNLVVENAGQHVIILLTGIGGVGKSLLLNLSKDKINKNGGSVVDIMDILYHKEQLIAFRGPVANSVIVAPATIKEKNRVIENMAKNLPDWSVISCSLKGLTRDEIKQYISAKMPDRMTMSLDQLADYSLGIPLLADDLLNLNLDADHALEFSVNFLANNSIWRSDQNIAAEMADKYLNQKPSADYLAAFCDHPPKIYDQLVDFMRLQRDVKSKTKVLPLFVAPQSEAIYNAMLANSEMAMIEIYAPSVTLEQAEIAYETLGIRCYPDSRICRFDDNLLNMYGASGRKVSLYIRDNQGHEMMMLREAEDLDILAEFYHSQITKGRYPISTGRRNSHELLVHSHEHEPWNPTKIGWLVETTLQNLAVSYLVNNFVYGKQYVYEAETKQIKEAGEAKMVDTFELKLSKKRQK